MEIPFNETTEQHMIEMQDAFNLLGGDAIVYDHYELEQMTSIPSYRWKEFLTDPRVSDYLNKELELMKQNKLRKALAQLDTNAKTPGAAQVLNALLSANKETAAKKEGPAFVYCYIPLSKEEKTADNVKIINKDPFIVEDNAEPIQETTQESVDITNSREYL